MKFLSGKTIVSVKAGSITLSEARKAARVAKAGRTKKLLANSVENALLRERYLGQFGSSTKKAASKRTKAVKKASASKRSTAKRAGAHKKR